MRVFKDLVGFNAHRVGGTSGGGDHNLPSLRSRLVPRKTASGSLSVLLASIPSAHSPAAHCGAPRDRRLAVQVDADGADLITKRRGGCRSECPTILPATAQESITRTFTGRRAHAGLCHACLYVTCCSCCCLLLMRMPLRPLASASAAILRFCIPSAFVSSLPLHQLCLILSLSHCPFPSLTPLRFNGRYPALV